MTFRYRALGAALSFVSNFSPQAALAVSDSTPISAGRGLLAESSVAVDPTDNKHIAVLADRYVRPTTIVLVESFDAGKTWSNSRSLVPPSFVSSYDSAAQFDSNGILFVAGGAARPTSLGCNADSSIFVAEVGTKGEIRYRIIRSVSGLGFFTDRPALARSPSGKTFVSWTESAGVNAACKGRPLKGSTWLSVSGAGDEFSEPVRIPSSGFSAPYGSALGLTGDGSLITAVGEYDSKGKSRLVVVESIDEGRTFSLPKVLTTRVPMPRRWKWKGWVSGVPSLASSPDGRVALSWVSLNGLMQSPIVFERLKTWVNVSPPSTLGGDTLLSTVRYDADNTMWIATVTISGPNLLYAADQRRQQWNGPQVFASSPAIMRELGELTGIATGQNVVVVAAVVDQTQRSLILVKQLTK